MVKDERKDKREEVVKGIRGKKIIYVRNYFCCFFFIFFLSCVCMINYYFIFVLNNSIVSNSLILSNLFFSHNTKKNVQCVFTNDLFCSSTAIYPFSVHIISSSNLFLFVLYLFVFPSLLPLMPQLHVFDVLLILDDL